MWSRTSFQIIKEPLEEHFLQLVTVQYLLYPVCKFYNNKAPSQLQLVKTFLRWARQIIVLRNTKTLTAHPHQGHRGGWSQSQLTPSWARWRRCDCECHNCMSLDCGWKPHRHGEKMQTTHRKTWEEGSNQEPSGCAVTTTAPLCRLNSSQIQWSCYSTNVLVIVGNIFASAASV